MKFPRLPVCAAMAAAALTLSLLVPSLASAQGLTYQGQQGESAGSSVQEQMPPAPEHPKINDVKRAKARELYFTADPVSARNALTLGIVNRVYPDEELKQETMAFAQWLAKGPRVALALMKKNLNLAESGTLSELLDAEAVGQISTGRTEDHREAAKAFVEKRAPVFVGR